MIKRVSEFFRTHRPVTATDNRNRIDYAVIPRAALRASSNVEPSQSSDGIFATVKIAVSNEDSERPSKVERE